MGEQRIASYCAQCKSRCGCWAVVEDGRLKGLEPMPEHPTGKALCPKGHASPELVHHPDRLTHPMRRVSPKGAATPEWQRVSWDEALDEIAARMADIRRDHGAEQCAFSVTTGSGTHISDSISWIQRFIRAYGSPNTIYSTEICNWHKDFATRFTYGWDIGTPDFAHSDCALIWGHNPATTWLARSGEIREARGRGMKTIVVEPRRTLYAKRADVWLRVRPGTDQALALGLINLLLNETGFDEAFAAEWTNARALVRRDTGRIVSGTEADTLFEERRVDGVDCATVLTLLRETVAIWTPDRVEEVTSVAQDELRAAARLLSESASVAYYCWNGVAQSATATQTDRAISILYSLLGHYGKQGGNVPGAAAGFADISGLDLITETQIEKALGIDQRPLGPGRQGWITAGDAYRAILEGDPYPVRMLFSFGGNLLSAQPETDRAHAALAQLDFHVHADFFLNEAAAYADIVLPVATSWERDALRTGFDASLEGQRRVQLRQAAIQPVGEAWSDTDVVFGLARRLGLSDQMFHCDIEQGRAAILAGSGVSMDQLRACPEGIDVAESVCLQPYLQSGFPTEDGRIRIYSELFLDHGLDPLPVLREHDLDNAVPETRRALLTTAKHVAYCHSQHRNVQSLRERLPDPVVEISPELAGREISDGDWVEVDLGDKRFSARAKIVADMHPDIVVAQHGWVDPADGGGAGTVANVNETLSDRPRDPISGSIAMRGVPCEVRPLADQ